MSWPKGKDLIVVFNQIHTGDMGIRLYLHLLVWNIYELTNSVLWNILNHHVAFVYKEALCV